MSDPVAALIPLVPALRRYAFALTRDRTLADDLVQDCLERAINRRHQLRQVETPRAWLFTILHRLTIDRLRQDKRRYGTPGHNTLLDRLDEDALAEAPPQEHRLVHQDLLRALAALPEEQRTVLLLVTVEGLSYADTAKVLDIPSGTVMSRLARARDRIRQLLEGAMPPEPRRLSDVRPMMRSVK